MTPTCNCNSGKVKSNRCFCEQLAAQIVARPRRTTSQPPALRFLEVTEWQADVAAEAVGRARRDCSGLVA
jgi:hypothetical protein